MQKAPARARNKLWDPALRRLLPPVADFGSVRFFARELAAGPPERRVTTTLGYCDTCARSMLELLDAALAARRGS